LGSKNQSNFFLEYASTNHTYRDSIEDKKKPAYGLVKRAMDIIFSTVGLTLSSPLVLIFAILIKAETSGPVFFLQERVGKDGNYFNVVKLRSMGVDAEKNGAKWAEKNDPRVTRVGAFIRKTRIDEIPQFINVLRGDMSLVGPRPERPVFTAQFDQQIPGFVDRLQIKPGLTGWAQVNGGYDITPTEKLRLDQYYLQHHSMNLDLKILLMTIKICITGSGAR